MQEAERSRVMFVYWGRRGLTQFSLEVARAALADQRLSATISVSRQNESFSQFGEFGAHTFPVDTFSTNFGALAQSWRIPELRRRLAARLRKDKTQVVIELMPHVWSSFIASSIREAGARYVTIVHEADAHPGDYRTRMVKRMLDRTIRETDLVLNLSDIVTRRLESTGRVAKRKLVKLFHPDIRYNAPTVLQHPTPGTPFKLLWLGRIMPYKGLPLFLDAVDILRSRGCAIDVGVFGEGPLGNCADRLSKLGAEVVNRWLTGGELASVLPRFHAVVLSHTEASQSGVLATALGAGLPCVATPVGGLIEQITDQQTGILAARPDAPALAEAIAQLILDPVLYQAICQHITRSRSQRSMPRFVEDCVSHALKHSMD
jgi:glycosyltransferase involved in cell wall biosynthesis